MKKLFAILFAFLVAMAAPVYALDNADTGKSGKKEAAGKDNQGGKRDEVREKKKQKRQKIRERRQKRRDAARQRRVFRSRQ